MMLKNIAILICSFWLAGCITTVTGKNIPVVDNKEAARLNLDLGISYLRQGRLEEARIKLDKSLKEDSSSATAHRALAMVYERLGDNSLAEKEYRSAAKLGSDDADSLNALGVFLCRRNDSPKESLTYFDKALAVPLYQGRYSIYTNAGTCAAKTNLIMAEGYLRKALDQNPSFPEALYQMASVSYRQDNFLQARAFLERYLVVAQPLPEVLLLGYNIETALSATNAAGKFQQQLLNEFPDSAEARKVLEYQRDAG